MPEYDNLQEKLTTSETVVASNSCSLTHGQVDLDTPQTIQLIVPSPGNNNSPAETAHVITAATPALNEHSGSLSNVAVSNRPTVKPFSAILLEALLGLFALELIWLFVVGMHTPTPNMTPSARFTGVVSLIVAICYQLFITYKIWRRREWSRSLCARITQIALVSLVTGAIAFPIAEVRNSVLLSFGLPLVLIWLLLRTKSVKDWVQ